MFISIEGVDGSGKTTIAKKLAKCLKYIYVEKPFSQAFDELNLSKYLEIKKNLKKLGSRKASCWFYGMNFIFASEYFCNKNIVYDRGLVSNFAYLLDDRTIQIFDLMVELGNLPDISIVLHTSKNILYERLMSRKGGESDLYKIDYADKVMDNIFFLLNKHNLKYINIDCSYLTINEIIESIISSLKNLQLI